MYAIWQEADKEKPDFVLWLNDDTILFKHAIEKIMADYKTLPPMSVLSGATCDSYEQKVTYGGNTTEMFS